MSSPTWEEVARLASQYDPLAMGGGMQKAAALADRVKSAYMLSGTCPFSLQELQICLSFECRNLQHCGLVPQGDDWTYLEALYQQLQRSSVP